MKPSKLPICVVTKKGDVLGIMRCRYRDSSKVIAETGKIQVKNTVLTV